MGFSISKTMFRAFLFLVLPSHSSVYVRLTATSIVSYIDTYK